MIIEEAKNRILILDGAMGTMVQRYNLTEDDFRGKQFLDHICELKGNNDILNLTRPDVIRDIHRQYIEAGADLIETNTFNSNIISQSDYQINESIVKDLNFNGAKIARDIADEFTKLNPSKPRYVCGVLGPTSKSLSISTDVNDASFREITFSQLVNAYSVATESLILGGVDTILIETIFDTLNAKAAIIAINSIAKKINRNIPIMISGTITDKAGRTLSGQTPTAFWTSLYHAPNLISFGFNCALGAEQLKNYIREISNIADVLVSAHPNAGLPNGLGGYNSSPDQFSKQLASYMKEGLVNIVGGCCGTNPDFIKALYEVSKSYSPRVPKKRSSHLIVSGLEPLCIDNKEDLKENSFINIGERTNVAGSKKFLRLIKEGDYRSALSIARNQVENGAKIIDINMDDGLIDGKSAMVKFLNLIASEPDISKVPIMIDSSKWEIIKAALECIQGKCIVNSISLKHGEKDFLEHAKEISLYGAAFVVMAFDENGQADTYNRKIQVCKRAYDLLISNGFNPSDIIFDPNVLTVSTGIEAHNNYAKDFINSIRWIKENLKGAKTSAGVSNVSFSFRGNDVVRSAMHSVFIHYAVLAGLDMAILNPAQITSYDEIDTNLRTAVEDVILNKDSEATDRLIALAEKIKESSVKTAPITLNQAKSTLRTLPPAERLATSMLKGIDDYIEEDIKEILEIVPNPLDIIEGPLMNGMNQVGDAFEAGRMFLPQVVKSARVMQKAVSCLLPIIEKENISSQRKSIPKKFVIATVKGDVHDIGKNIISVVLACNGFKIIDLGVMVPQEKIIEAAKIDGVVAVGLSGLITPSLDEMVKVAKEMQKNHLSVPLLIGGATTSIVHTALKIAPEYDGGVIYASDASQMVKILKKICNKEVKNAFLIENSKLQAEIRSRHNEQKEDLISLESARNNKFLINWKEYTPVKPKALGITKFDNYSIEELAKFIDWGWFLSGWGLKGQYPDILESKQYGEESKKLLNDAKLMLEDIINRGLLKARGVIGLYATNSINEEIEIYSPDNFTILDTFDLPRLLKDFSNYNSSNNDHKYNASLADFIIPKELKQNDYIGMFAISTGFGIENITKTFENNDYKIIMAKILADRLVEAFSEILHQRVRDTYWGYDTKLNPNFAGIRPAIGYPILPNHALKTKVFKLLNVEKDVGIQLTENYAMNPPSSICGLYFANPKAWYYI